jgi:predicted lipoprotein with Yx(FWY)xxD motif
MRSSNIRFLAVAALAALALAACSSSSKTSTDTSPAATTTLSTTAPTSAQAPAGKTTVAIATTSLGKVLVDSSGRTLYLYDKDKGDGTSACTGQCLQVWPPLSVTSTATYGPGLTATTFTTITRPDGTKQLAVNGKPLYLFASDTAPGDTKGQDIGDFYAAGANGKKIDNS